MVYYSKTFSITSYQMACLFFLELSMTEDKKYPSQ